MNKDELKKMLGMSDGGGGSFYKLNKVTMSGDDGKFRLTDLTTERKKGDKPATQDLGVKVNGIILKMRWVLELWDERNKIYYSSNEYDDKHTDPVTIYPPKAKGTVEEMKAKYGLKTLRVIYLHVPDLDQTVRLYVKASALSGKDKNENGELGLFEYISELTNDDLLPCHVFTTFEGTFRNGKNEDGTPNKRKDHYAMHFTRGVSLDEKRQEMIYEMMADVDAKTKTKGTVEATTDADDIEDDDESARSAPEPLDQISDNPELDPDSIPF